MLALSQSPQRFLDYSAISMLVVSDPSQRFLDYSANIYFGIVTTNQPNVFRLKRFFGAMERDVTHLTKKKGFHEKSKACISREKIP